MARFSNMRRRFSKLRGMGGRVRRRFSMYKNRRRIKRYGSASMYKRAYNLDPMVQFRRRFGRKSRGKQAGIISLPVIAMLAAGYLLFFKKK